MAGCVHAGQLGTGLLYQSPVRYAKIPSHRYGTRAPRGDQWAAEWVSLEAPRLAATGWASVLRGQEWFDGPIRVREASHSQVAGVTPTLCSDITHDAVLPYRPTALRPRRGESGCAGRGIHPARHHHSTPPQPLSLFWWVNDAKMRHTVAHALKLEQCELNLLARRTVG